jgi:hypothetical protein
MPPAACTLRGRLFVFLAGGFGRSSCAIPNVSSEVGSARRCSWRLVVDVNPVAPSWARVGMQTIISRILAVARPMLPTVAPYASPAT